MKPLCITLFGWPVRVGVGFFSALCLILLVDRTGTMRWCLLAAALHECGHLAAMRAVHWPECEIRLTAFGIQLRRRDRTPFSYRTERIVALAGPVTNLAAGTLLLVCSRIFPQSPQLQTAMLAEYSIGLFNLLPADPLDGGQALHAFLNGVLPQTKAEKITELVTFAVLVPLATLTFLSLFRQRFNFSLLAATIYLVIFFALKSR